MNIRMALLVLVAASVLPRMAAAEVAVEPAKAPVVKVVPTIVATPAAAAAAQPAPAVSPAVSPASASTSGEGATFVDRDGDGIQDGQEHRFRKHGKGAQGHWAPGMGDGAGGMRRFRGGGGGNGPRQDGGK